MSLEAWGDEGDVAGTWADTAICQDFQEIYNKFLNWKRIYRNEFPNDDFSSAVNAMTELADEISDQMVGKL